MSVRHSLWVVSALFLLSPTQHPWYFVWVLPLLAIDPPVRHAGGALLLYVPLLPLYYLVPDHRWLVWMEHVPVWIGLAASGLVGWWRRRKPDGGRNFDRS